MFEITVVSNTPLTPVSDFDTVATTLLYQVGYLPKGYDPKTETESVRSSVPYKLVVNCLLKRPEKAWTIDELCTVLSTSRPTVYRHLNKLKAMDLLEESIVRPESSDGQPKKAYRARYGNISKAWNFVEAHVKVAMDNYRKTVDHLQALSEREKKRIEVELPRAPVSTN
ncbi:MAG: ArsR family transcriptional regulator [Candidatus Rokuibacteriota bacterium]